MTLQVFSFSQLVSNIATAVQGSASALLDFAVGSPLRAIAESIAGVVLWLQAIILQVLTLTRKATSTGADKDSWVGDFGMTRLPARAATGIATFSRFTSSQQGLVPAGGGVQTLDGTQNFTVAIDATLASWDPVQNGYVLPPGTASISVPAVATIAGTAANIQAGTLGTITSNMAGVDTVTNPSAFLDGIDAESDPALDARFILYLSSLSKGTKTAIGYAITSTQQGLTYTITENHDYDGTYDNGYSSIILDDGSGSPSTNLLNIVAAAVDAVRPLGSRVAVFAPVVLTANVSMVLTTAAGYVHSSVTSSVVAALQNFINGLPLAVSLPWSQLAAVAYGVPGVANVSGVLLNGSTADLNATVKNKLRAGSVVVS